MRWISKVSRSLVASEWARNLSASLAKVVPPAAVEAAASPFRSR
jgi:hypothetical protein